MNRKLKTSGADTEEELFIVDKILDKKTEGGKAKYLIRWQGYDESDDTWEPLESLEMCIDTVKEFDEEYSAKKEAEMKNKRKRKRNHSRNRNGKIQPKRVIGATDECPNKEGLQFLVELSNGETDLISREEMHQLCPQVLIDFYESKTQWMVAAK